MSEYRLAFEAVLTTTVEDLAQTFYDNFDGMVVERAGQIVVTVYLGGRTALQAAHAAIAALEGTMPLSICHVDLDLVDAPEIATRLEVKRQAVHLWATGQRGSGFPRPAGSPGGKRIWVWNEIVEWARENQNSTETPGLSRDEIALVDAFLAERRRPITARAWPVKAGASKTSVSKLGPEDYQRSHLTLLGVG